MSSYTETSYRHAVIEDDFTYDDVVFYFKKQAENTCSVKGIPEVLYSRKKIIVPITNFYTDDIVFLSDLPVNSELFKAYYGIRFSLPLKTISYYKMLSSVNYLDFIPAGMRHAYFFYLIDALISQGGHFDWLDDEVVKIREEIDETGTYNGFKNSTIMFDNIVMRMAFKEHLIAASFIASVSGKGRILEPDMFGFIPLDRLHEIIKLIEHLPFFTEMMIRSPEVKIPVNKSKWSSFVDASSELLRLVNNLYVNSGYDYWKTYYFILNNELCDIAAVASFSDIDNNVMSEGINIPKVLLTHSKLTEISETNLNYSSW